MTAIFVWSLLAQQWWTDHRTSLSSAAQLSGFKVISSSPFCKFICAWKPGESCQPRSSILMPLVHQRHHCQGDDRLLNRHTGKSRSWWTIRGADSSVKWAATLTRMLITAVSVRKASAKTAEHDFPTWKCLQLGYAWWNLNRRSERRS